MQDNDPYLQNADAENMRHRLCSLYQTTDKVTEYLISRESRSRMGDDKFSIVDVRFEPTCKWMMVYYTLV